MIRFQCFKSPAEPNKDKNKKTLKNEPNPKNEHLTGFEDPRQYAMESADGAKKESRCDSMSK